MRVFLKSLKEGLERGGTSLTPHSHTGKPEAHTFEIFGAGWERAAVDVVLSGLGWFSLTGVGPHAPPRLLWAVTTSLCV